MSPVAPTTKAFRTIEHFLQTIRRLLVILNEPFVLPIHQWSAASHLSVSAKTRGRQAAFPPFDNAGNSCIRFSHTLSVEPPYRKPDTVSCTGHAQPFPL